MASAVIAKGNASIEINSRETEARLVFVPDPEGDGWDAAAVHKLASEKDIRVGTDPKNLESFLSKAARAKTSEPMDLLVCQGLEPEPAVSEKVNWEPLHVPGDIAPFQKEILAGAGPPVIFRIRTEKIKHERKIKKPAALPFMSAREEIAVTWEKKETREKVDVDPSVMEVRYAVKGTKLGTVNPPVPGKPGKSIFGRPIPSQSPEDGSWFFGKGIFREKNDIRAGVSGFIRIGKNWADEVPFSKHSYSTYTGIDGHTLFFSFEPGDMRFKVPAGDEILNEVAGLDSAENLIGKEELDEAIAEAIRTREPLQAFSLFRTREAEARVEINPEKTRAVLFLRKGVAGALPLEMKAIAQALKDSGVHGYDPEKLKVDINTFMEGKDLQLSDYVLVEGRVSTRGKDREVTALVSPLSDDEKKIALSRLGSWKGRDSLKISGFDFLAAPGLAFVEKNTVVARVNAGSNGEEGKDVFGNIIPGLPGNDPDVRLIRGLELHGQEIRSSQNGLLLMSISEKSFRGMVIDYQDAKIKIQISDDGMEAHGDFFREEGAGVPLTLENVKKVLAALGVKKGIDWEGLENACVLARTRGNVLGYILARGEAPLAKGASAIKWLVPFNPPELTGEADAEAAAGRTVQVKAGDPIVELSEPVAAGRPGYDVRGNEIPIDSGANLDIEHDNSVKVLRLGKGRRLIAARSGELRFDGKRLEINSVKLIDGNAGGNIRFSGEIQICGNVLPGCAIIGESHISVEGLAEQAFISAGGKALVAKGFRGGGKGILRARAGIEAAFVERASVMAVGDIRLKKGSILSLIKTNGKLHIASESGRLTGGICQARHGVDTGDIGSEKGIRTEISFGQDYLVKEQIGACEEEIEKARRILSETEEKIKERLKKNLPLPDELKNEKVRLVKLLEQCNIKVFTLREKFEEHHESEVRCRGTVYPGVVIESHDRYYEVKQKRMRVVFYFDRSTGSIKERFIE